MNTNRDKAQELLDAIDKLAEEADKTGGYASPQAVQWVNATVTNLMARAQIHAILALTDPADAS